MYMPFLNMFIHFLPLLVKKRKLRPDAAASSRPHDADACTDEQEQVSADDADAAQAHDLGLTGELETRPADLTGLDNDFVEASLNLDEFDVDLDRNEFFSIDDILNEDYAVDFTEKLGELGSFKSGHN